MHAHVFSPQLLAIKELDVHVNAPEPSAVVEHASHIKFNSTSSYYIDSTITKPCIDEIIFCVSVCAL